MLHVRGAELWSRCSALSYANAGLTSAVRSKQGRGTLELSLPPLRLTHPDLSLCPTHTHTHTHHAYLSGAIPPPHAGFYSCVWLKPTQAALRKDFQSYWDLIFRFCSAERRRKGEVKLCLSGRKVLSAAVGECRVSLRTWDRFLSLWLLNTLVYIVRVWL